jgi:hypothetical protein
MTACVVDTCGDLPLASLTPVANLHPFLGYHCTSWRQIGPPVSMTPVDNFAANAIGTSGALGFANIFSFLKKFERIDESLGGGAGEIIH